MIIKRMINGSEMEIELTKEELYDAYCEQEENWDLETCEDYFDTVYWSEEWYNEINDETRQNIIADATAEYRRNINKYDMNHEYALDDAFSRVVSNYIQEE